MADIIDISDFREADQGDPNQPVLIHTVDLQLGGVIRFYQVPTGPDLPWTPIADIAGVLGLSPDEIPLFVGAVGIQWLPSLKVVTINDQKIVIVPFLGAAALLTQFEGEAEEGSSPLEFFCDGAADAVGLSSGASSKGQFFQNFVVAARSAASPIDLYGAIKPLGAEASA